MSCYVFVSHLSDDNLRLGAYIDRLLSRLDAETDLWIDTPEHIRAEFGRHPRVRPIPPGEQWNDEIDRAIKGADCVLVFWSARFSERDRTVFLKEIDVGRMRGRCVQIAIDGKKHCKVPQPFNFDQILEVVDLEQPADATKFDRVITRIKSLINKPDSALAGAEYGKHYVHVDSERVPYLADRHPQMSPICMSVAEREDRVQDAATAIDTTQACLFLVPCGRDDVADTFPWRLTHKDGPEYCGFDKRRDTPTWVHGDLRWPDTTTLTSFKEDFIALNKTPARLKLNEARERKRPICFSTDVDASNIDADLQEFARAWIEAWPDLLSSTGVDLRSTPPIIGLLLMMFAGRKSWFGELTRFAGLAKPDSVYIAERCQSLISIGSIVQVTDILEVSPLPPLAPITSQDAYAWLALPDIRDHKLDVRARAAIRRVFGRHDRTVTMHQFAEAIHASER